MRTRVRTYPVKMKRTMAAALAALALGGTAALAGPASAEDIRPCVSKVEYREAGKQIHLPSAGPRRTQLRSELEAQWEVTGMGHRDPDLSGRYIVGYDYPACGYSAKDAQVWVIYNRSSHQVGAIYWWRA